MKRTWFVLLAVLFVADPGVAFGGITIEGIGYNKSVQLTRWSGWGEWNAPVESNDGGTIHIFVRNTGGAPESPTSVTVNGETATLLVTIAKPVNPTGNIAWARVWPRTINPGEVATVTVVSMNTALGEGATANVQVDTSTPSSATGSTTLTTPTLKIGCVVASQDMMTLNVYLRNLDTSSSYTVTNLIMNNDVTANCTFVGGSTIGPKSIGIVKVAYAAPVPLLTPIAIRVQTMKDGVTPTEVGSYFRVLKPWYPIGNYSSTLSILEGGQQFARQLQLDLNTGSTVETDVKYMAAKYHIQNWNRPNGNDTTSPYRHEWVQNKVASGDTDLAAYYTAGEPEYNQTTSFPAEVNWRSQWIYYGRDPFHSLFMENAVTKAFNAYAPTVDTPSMDHYVMYAPSSIVNTWEIDPEYPTVPMRAGDMWEAVEYNDLLKLNAEPLQTWPWLQLCLESWPRQAYPFGINQQFWIGAMSGAKGLLWFRYASDPVPGYGYEGIYPTQIAEAVTVTREFSQVRSLLLYGEAIDNATVSDPNLLAAKSIIGEKAMVVIVANMNSSCDLNSPTFDYTLTDTPGTVTVPIPSWITPADVYEVTPAGSVPASMMIAAGQATFTFTAHDTLIYVIGEADTQAPGAPLNLNIAQMPSATSMVLSWREPVDNFGVKGYKVYRNGAEIGDVRYPLFTDAAADVHAAYTVKAYDAAGNLSAPSIGAKLGGWPFDNSGYFDVWFPRNQYTATSWNNGVLTFTATGTDPQVLGPRSQRIDAAAFKYLKIRMKNGTPGNDAQFFWTTTASGSFNETKSKHIALVPNDAGFTEYSADLSTVAAWTGTVTSFRFDPTNAAGSVEIDSIVLRDNRPPVASVSATQLVWEATSCSGATVTLDGSLSSDPDGDALTYQWLEGGSPIATGVTANVPLSIGAHAIQLKVMDPFGATSTADITVTVQALTVAADLDQDCDVDAEDIELFRACASGPGIPYSEGCSRADFDADNDVDMDDFGCPQRCFSGAGVSPDPNCMN